MTPVGDPSDPDRARHAVQYRRGVTDVEALAPERRASDQVAGVTRDKRVIDPLSRPSPNEELISVGLARPTSRPSGVIDMPDSVERQPGRRAPRPGVSKRRGTAGGSDEPHGPHRRHEPLGCGDLAKRELVVAILSEKSERPQVSLVVLANEPGVDSRVRER